MKKFKIVLSLALILGLAASAILMAPKKANQVEKISAASWVSDNQSRLIAGDGGGDGGGGDGGTGGTGDGSGDGDGSAGDAGTP